EFFLCLSRKYFQEVYTFFYAYPIFFHKDIAAVVRKIEPEKSSKVREAEKFLTSNPKCASAPQLNAKVNEANNKYDKINLLLKCSEDKLQNSNRLENSLQNGKSLLSSYENKLAREEVAPADISSLEKTQRQLAVRSDLSLILIRIHVYIQMDPLHKGHFIVFLQF
uniref:Periplakin n=1 Tax=Hucho hucho TaxID=62062 RepID=A0A4W5KFD8_9TELE